MLARGLAIAPFLTPACQILRWRRVYCWIKVETAEATPTGSAALEV